MRVKNKIAILGLSALIVTPIYLGSANATTYYEVHMPEDRQSQNVPPPQTTAVNQNQPNTFTSIPNTYSNPYSAVYLNPVINNQINTNYQTPLNPSTYINTNAGDLSTWNSTYAVGNYGISQNIDQPEFAVNSISDFADTSPVKSKIEIPVAGKIKIENSNPSDIDSPAINKSYLPESN